MMNPANEISTAIVFATSFLFAAGCDPFSDVKVDYSAKTCFLVLDDLTTKPLANVSVRVSEFSGTSRFAGTTDASGSFCFESRGGDYYGGFAIRVDGYELNLFSICGSPRCTLRLKPAAVLRVRAKNLPPTANDDRLMIEYPPSHFLVGNDSLGFYGSEIDTLVNLLVRLGTISMKWRSWHHSMIVDSATITIATTPGDTTLLEVLY